MKLLNSKEPELTTDSISEYIIWAIKKHCKKTNTEEVNKTIICSILDSLIKRGAYQTWSLGIHQNHTHVTYVNFNHTIGFVDIKL